VLKQRSNFEHKFVQGVNHYCASMLDDANGGIEI